LLLREDVLVSLLVVALVLFVCALAERATRSPAAGSTGNSILYREEESGEVIIRQKRSGKRAPFALKEKLISKKIRGWDAQLLVHCR
jgi:hypothetical protein